MLTDLRQIISNPITKADNDDTVLIRVACSCGLNPSKMSEFGLILLNKR